MQDPEDSPISQKGATPEHGELLENVGSGTSAASPAAAFSDKQAEEYALIQRVAHEDELAFDAIVARYGRPLFARLLRLEHGDAGYCEEILQEVWLKVWQFAPKFRADQPLFTWLYRVAVNVRIDLWRRRRGFDEMIPIDPGLALLGTPGVIADIEDPEPFEPLDPLALRRLPECIRKLSPRMQALVRMRIEGIPLREIVEVLGTSTPTVHRDYKRALEQLRACIERKVLN